MGTLDALTTEDLWEMCCDSHKDFYGIKGRFMYGWTREELESWWHNHFKFDAETKCWNNTQPFCD